MNKIKISENRSIGENEPPFIIAEIGNNHNGSLDNALKLIKIANDIGVDAVKFQVKNIEKSFSQKLLDSAYVTENSFGKTYREHKQALEFSKEQLVEIYEFSRKLGIICFSTPFDTDSVDLLETIDNPIYKISSFHVTDMPLIEKVSKTKKPIIMSTGMSSIDEIDKAVELIRNHNDQLILLQCTSCYPTDDKDVNLAVIPSLRNRYSCPIGYSGHERGLAICTSAVTLGACVIEKHFTSDRTLKGPDHASSIEPIGMKDIVLRSKKIFNALGNSNKSVLDCELKNRQKFRGY
ncbi:MAG: N-acetylneuraminate synthase [Thaumarchaeota archaeon]|jgi:sialic acid synthase SpsE|nr:MAG: N-acetylneuraminate synthase [Nitrososphaerota archaeon]